MADGPDPTAVESNEVPPGSLRDLITVIDGGDEGCAATISTIGPSLRTYEQLRDYTDTTVVAVVDTFRFTQPKPDRAHPLPGEFEMDVRVEDVLGGRLGTVAAGDVLTPALSTDATAADFAELGPSLDRRRGAARLVLFMFQVVESDGDPSLPVRCAPITCNSPTGLLAEWPGDGRLTSVRGTDYFAREAIARGEELTGTSLPRSVEWVPTFTGPPPVGMTVEQVRAAFVNRTGEPLVPPPQGWEELVEPRLVPVP